MLRQTDKQWLEENDIIDRYLLGQLTEEEIQRFNEVLAYSDDLKDEIAFQATLAAAIREYSRTDIKRRLREAIQKSYPIRMDTAVEKHRTLHYWMYIRAAAVILLFLGGLWLLYLRMAEDKSPAPVVEEKTQKNNPVKEEVKLPPKQEVISEYREPQKNEQPVKRVTTRRTTEERKPPVLSAPSDSAHGGYAQKFPINAALFPRPNEVKASLELTDDNLQTETRIVFKNPTDLTAVNLIPSSEDKNGFPEWFYVHWEKPVLNVYLDYTRYLNLFKGAKIVQQKQDLLLLLDQHNYHVRLQEGTKFHKAVIGRK